MNAALEMADVAVEYPGSRFGRTRNPVRALAGVSLHVDRGECVGVIGESGSGKSTLAAVALGLNRHARGAVRVAGQHMGLDARQRPHDTRRALQMVFQDPNGSLNPTMRVRSIVAEGLAIHRIAPGAAREVRVAEALREVGLGDAYLDRRPHELSGGQRQRVAIARALAVEPDVVILDEPTSALDLSVQAQILNLLLATQQRRNLAYLLISHDIEVIRHLCQRVYVMCAGEVVEQGETAKVIETPDHPYTRRLIAAAPGLPA